MAVFDAAGGLGRKPIGGLSNGPVQQAVGQPVGPPSEQVEGRSLRAADTSQRDRVSGGTFSRTSPQVRVPSLVQRAFELLHQEAPGGGIPGHDLPPTP